MSSKVFFNEIKWIILIASVLAAILVIGCICVLCASEAPEAPIQNLFAALQKEDFEQYCASFHPVYSKKMLENVPLLPDRSNFMKEVSSLFKKEYGKQYQFSLQIISKDRYKDADLEELRTVLGADGITFSDAYLISYYTLLDENGLRECIDSSTVIKCSGKWYIAD